MKWTRAHFRLLFDAYDSSNLPELLFETKGPADKTIHPGDWPALPLRDAKRALLDLVSAGYVVLIGERELPREEALRVVNSDAPWENQFPDTPNYYEVSITDQGRTAYMEEILPHYWPEGV